MSVPSVKCETSPTYNVYCLSCNQCYASPNAKSIEASATVISTLSPVPSIATTASSPEIISSSIIRPFACDICHKSYSRKSSLRLHQKRHSGVKPFVCTHEGCGKAFIEKGNLKTHMRTHTGERPYTCDVCHKSFITLGHLTDHKRRHTGERPFKCDECDAAFMRTSTLKIHKRRHTGEKPYKCTKCDKAFTESGNLKTHMRTHTGERPYVCMFEGCEKRFVTKGHLIEHHNSRKHAT